MFQVREVGQTEWDSVDEVNVRLNVLTGVCQNQADWNSTFNQDVLTTNRLVRDMQSGKVVTVGNHEFRFTGD